jgi:putative SOS response-associated peptidase YedK
MCANYQPLKHAGLFLEHFGVHSPSKHWQNDLRPGTRGAVIRADDSGVPCAELGRFGLRSQSAINSERNPADSYAARSEDAPRNPIFNVTWSRIDILPAVNDGDSYGATHGFLLA